jgi:hypothetical protein
MLGVGGNHKPPNEAGQQLLGGSFLDSANDVERISNKRRFANLRSIIVKRSSGAGSHIWSNE